MKRLLGALFVTGLLLTLGPAALAHASISITSNYGDRIMVMHKGETKQFKASGVRKGSFRSSNSLIAKVSKSGKVKSRQLGNCTITATRWNGTTVTWSVGVTTKRAYRAVRNAKIDSKKNIKYSIPKRMKTNYRDCSSFVSRCYWDTKLKRRIFYIGPAWIKSYGFALSADQQAQWLAKNGHRVSYKQVSTDKLLPGDTVYYYTGASGKNSYYRHIDHAAIYVGGGWCLDTNGPLPNGSVTLNPYRPYYSPMTVKFIGRPITAFMLDRSLVTLNKGKSTTLKARYAKGAKVTFKSSKSRIAKVNSKGKVVAKRKGTCVITAKSSAGTYRCKVKVV